MGSTTARVLREHSTFDVLTDEELERLAPTLESRHCAPGDVLFEEGDTSTEMFFLRAGCVSIRTRDDEDGDEYELARFEAPALFGELAFLDGSGRSATARAESDVEILVLDPSVLDSLEGGAEMHERLLYKIALASTDRLKRTNENYVESLKARIDAMRLQMEFGEFFVYILACQSIGTIINVLLHSHFRDVNVYARTFSWSYLMVLLLPSLVIVRQQHMPLERLGITREGWRRSLGEGVAMSFACVVLAALVLVVAPRAGWFTPPPFSSAALAWVPSYMVHSALQEFLARGIVQTSFQRFFGDRGGWKSILLASLIFSLFHVHFGLTAVIITFVSGLAFGRLYWRHQNLIGVSLLHGVAGSCGFLLGAL